MPDLAPVQPEVAKQDPRDAYWASTDVTKIGQLLVGRVRDYNTSAFLKGVQRRWAIAYAHYLSTDPSGVPATSYIARAGDVGELCEVKVNHPRALVNTLKNLVSANRVVWAPKASNASYQSLAECELAAAILEWHWKEQGFEAANLLALESAIAFGEGLTMITWDEFAGDDVGVDPDTGKVTKSGSLVVENIYPWDCLRDSTKRSWDALEWMIVRKRVNKYTLAAKYPDQVEHILRTATEVQPETRVESGTGQREADETDDVTVYRFMHKKTPAMPNGRDTLFLLNQAVLADDDLRHDEIPVYRVAAGELIGTSYGYTPFFDILGIQDLVDSLESSIATNQTTLSTQCIAIEIGSEVPIDQIAGGMRAIYYAPGAKPPQPLQLTATPAEVFAHLKEKKHDQELIMGISSVVRGEAQSGEMSGSALALLQSQALMQSSGLQGSWMRSIEGQGNCVIQTVRERLAVERQVDLVGKGNEFLLSAATYSGESFNRVKRVQVEIGAPLAQSAAGRSEIAKELINLGLIKSPEQYISVLKTGKLEPLTSSLRNELMLIRAENEALARGEQPPAIVIDDHLLHAREHRSMLASTEARSNPDVVKAVLEHIQMHEDLYYSAPASTLVMMGMSPPTVPPPEAMGGPQGGPQGGAGPDGQAPKANPAGMPGNPQAGSQPKPPRQPTNPASGRQWDPKTGGGMVDAPQA